MYRWAFLFSSYSDFFGLIVMLILFHTVATPDEGGHALHCAMLLYA